MTKKIISEEENQKKIKAVRRQKKKRPKMKVSGRSVVQLKKIIEDKSKKK